MVLAGLAALSWSVIGLYLLHHATDRQLSHTTLPWAQFWLLDHIRAMLGGAALGILICVLASPALYRRRTSGAPASNQSQEPTAGRRDVTDDTFLGDTRLDFPAGRRVMSPSESLLIHVLRPLCSPSPVRPLHGQSCSRLWRQAMRKRPTKRSSQPLASVLMTSVLYDFNTKFAAMLALASGG